MSLLKDMTEPDMKRARQSESKSESESKGNEDRLSDLPDCLLLHILSFVKSKDAVQTCVLSPRWKHLWKSVPTLVLRASDFGTVKIFHKFMTRLLSLRDGSVALHTLDFQRSGIVEPHVLRRVLNYAISHYVHQLRIRVRADIDGLLPSIFSSIFTCQTLTSLKLSVVDKNYSDGRIVFPKSLNLPALTSLYLVNIAFCASDNDRAEPFSTLNRLSNLVIKDCTVLDAQILYICNATLSSLTLCDRRSYLYKVPKSQNSTLDVILLPSISSRIFSCQTLTSLELSTYCERGTLLPKSLNLPALINLLLHRFVFCASDNHQAEPFLACHRLKNLSIEYCTLEGAQILYISSPTLSSLTIRSNTSNDSSFYKIVLSTPNLCSFAFAGIPLHDISGSSLSSLEQVNIDADTLYCLFRSLETSLTLLNWLKELANVQSLTVTSDTLQVLLLFPDLLNIKLPSFGKLKSLKVKMKPHSFIFRMSTGSAKARDAKMKKYLHRIIDFLLQNSPSAEVSITKF